MAFNDDPQLSIDELSFRFNNINIGNPIMHDNDYNSGYKDGYNDGYNDACEDLCEKEIFDKSNISAVGNKLHKPRFGWKIAQDRLIADEKEQIVIAAIRKLLYDFPNITLQGICHNLTRYGFYMRKSAKIYPATVRNIIRDNNLR